MNRCDSNPFPTNPSNQNQIPGSGVTALVKTSETRNQEPAAAQCHLGQLIDKTGMGRDTKGKGLFTAPILYALVLKMVAALTLMERGGLGDRAELDWQGGGGQGTGSVSAQITPPTH